MPRRSTNVPLLATKPLEGSTKPHEAPRRNPKPHEAPRRPTILPEGARSPSKVHEVSTDNGLAVGMAFFSFAALELEML